MLYNYSDIFRIFFNLAHASVAETRDYYLKFVRYPVLHPRVQQDRVE